MRSTPTPYDHHNSTAVLNQTYSKPLRILQMSRRRIQIDPVDAESPRFDNDIETLDNDSRPRDNIGDHLNVQSRPYIMKILEKQGDRTVLFADKVIKFTGSGKMKHRILLITDFALYIVDPDTDTLKRRIALAAVEKICLSKLSDNFFAIIIPTEYDLLMASTRKNEIVTVLAHATKSASDFELEVSLSNRFQYNSAAETVKEIEFVEVEGGVKTRIVRK